MDNAATGTPTLQKPLRLWPGVVIVTVQWFFRFVLPAIAPNALIFGTDTALLGIIAGPVGALAILIWWLFFSRAQWSERLGAIVVMIVAVMAIRPLTHVSIQNGMMGMMFFVYAVPPTLSLALVIWAAASRRLSRGPRWASLVVAIVLACGAWLPVRTDGLFFGAPDLAWRWTLDAEARLLAQTRDEPFIPAPPVVTPPPAPAAPRAAAGNASAPPVADAAIPAAAKTEALARVGPAMSEPGNGRVEWSGFRGPLRDGAVRGSHLSTDWSASPPVQIWRRPIGPGWSSFAVSGDLLYTQEQRGDNEIVACHRVSTGEPVWRHRDPARFWESNGGAGPRGTPTLANGRVYTFGATGIVNALDAATGKVVWSRNAPNDTGAKLPGWGFTSSPLAVGDLIVVAASGTMVGYDAATGAVRWTGPTRGGSYSSPHLATFDGVAQVVLLTGTGATSVAPADGTVLWEHAWPGGSIVQPALTADGDIVINSIASTGGVGTRRLHITRSAAGWTVEERWTSNGLKPYFNDFVIHKGYAFGFDGSILSSISLEDGKRAWKNGRYGNGQMVVLRDQDLLLVLSEEGELALVSATPEKFTELARFPALDGKTWNHPVLIPGTGNGAVLLLRNGEEMAAFRLPLAR